MIAPYIFMAVAAGYLSYTTTGTCLFGVVPAVGFMALAVCAVPPPTATLGGLKPTYLSKVKWLIFAPNQVGISSALEQDLRVLKRRRR